MQREFISVRLCIGLMVLGLATLQARAQDPIEISGGCWNSNQCSMPEPVTGMTRVFGGPGWCVVGTSAGVLRWWFSTSYYPAGGSMQGVDYSRGVGVGGSHLVAARPDGSFSGIAFDYYGNYYGQLNAPSDLGSIRRITAGGEHTVLVQTDGLIRCFGRNNEGQCNAPTGSDFVDVRSKAYHSAAWRADGSVVCWGRNWYGQCNVPADLPPVQHVSVGSFGTVALLEDGSLRAWGSVPSLPLKLPPLEEIDISDSHGVGRTATGEVICWGSDGSGECGGVGHGYTRRKPASLGSVVSIAAIAGVTATVDAAGSYVAWGNDSGGMCSLPQTVHPIRDAAVWGSAAMWLRKDGTMVVRPGFGNDGMRVSAEGLKFKQLISGEYGAPGAITCEGELKVWGNQINARFPGSARFVKKVAIGSGHAVAIDRGDNLRYWMLYPQPTWSPMPTGVVGAIDVAASYYHSLALDGRGRVFAWGDNSYQSCDVPVDLAQAQAVAAGYYSSLALLSDGSIRTWGNIYGGPETVPAEVGTVRRLFASSSWRVAQRVDGSWCRWSASSTALQWQGQAVWLTPELALNSQTPWVDVTAAPLPPIAFGIPVERTFQFSRTAASDVQLVIGAVADLNLSTEFASLRLDGSPFANIFVAEGRDCPSDPDYVTLSIPRDTFNGLIGDGRLVVRLDGSAGVNGAQCLTGYTSIRIAYQANVVDCNANGISDEIDVASRNFNDCDRNGILDVCDFAAGTVVDFDGNGVIDACEPDCNDNAIPDAFEISTGEFEDCNGNLIPDPCDTAFGEQDKDGDGRIDECEISRGDFDLSGYIDGADLGALLALWGFADPPYGDLDRDGLVAGGDLSILLGSWGPVR